MTRSRVYEEQAELQPLNNQCGSSTTNGTTVTGADGMIEGI